MNQFKFGDHVKHPKHKGKLIFIESFEEVSLLKKEWAEVLSEEAGDFVFVPLEELEPASQEEAPATKYRHINGHKFPEPCRRKHIMKNSKLLLKQIEQVKNPNYVPPPHPRLITNNPNGWNDAIANPPQKTDGYLVKYGCVGACLSVGRLHMMQAPKNGMGYMPMKPFIIGYPYRQALTTHGQKLRKYINKYCKPTHLMDGYSYA